MWSPQNFLYDAFLRAIALVSSVFGMLIVIAAISTQPIMSLFLGLVSSRTAWIISLIAFYCAYSVGLGWYLIGISLICAVCGVIGSPYYLFQSLINSPEPEPQVKVKKGTETKAHKKQKRNRWVAKIHETKILRYPFRMILFILGIVDTLFNTMITHSGESQRSWIWDLLYEMEEEFYEYEEVYGGEVVNDYPDELWIHVNGILNTLGQAKGTCKDMYEMFGRPVKLLHNPTDGPLLDLTECMMGKTGLLRRGYTGPRKLLRDKLENEIMNKDYKKIVVVAHSQGTIITGNVLSDLNDIVDGIDSEDGRYTLEERKTLEKNMKKLEVYLVAPAAHIASGKHINHLECISNRGDVVAVLGHLFPDCLKPFWRNTRGDGIRYLLDKDNCHVENANWGHTLRFHYFDPMEEGCFKNSKLQSYLVKKKNPEGEKVVALETSKLLTGGKA